MKFKLFSLLFFVLGMHRFITTGGFYDSDHQHGHIRGAVPTYWAWKLNPALMEKGSRIVGDMGQATIALTKEVCQPVRLGYGPPLICETYATEIEKKGIVMVENRPWQYGPVLHFVFFPFLFSKDLRTAMNGWWWLILVLFLVTAALWYQMTFLTTHGFSIASLAFYLGVWFCFQPTIEAVNGGEIEILQFFFLSLAFFLSMKNRDTLSGVALGFAIMVKYLPIGFIPYFLLKRRYKLVTSALITVAVMALLAQWLLDWRWAYVFRMAQPFGYALTYIFSQNISSTVHRLLSDLNVLEKPLDFWVYPKALHEAWAVALSKGAVLVTAIISTLYFWRHRRAPVNLYEISFLLLLMITLPNWNHHYYFLFFLPALSFVFSTCLKEKRWAFFSGSFLAFFFMGLIFSPPLIQKTLFPSYPLFFELYSFYSIPILGVLIFTTILLRLRSTSFPEKEFDITSSSF